jgi:hypothetical protein
MDGDKPITECGSMALSHTGHQFKSHILSTSPVML